MEDEPHETIDVEAPTAVTNDTVDGDALTTSSTGVVTASKSSDDSNEANRDKARGSGGGDDGEAASRDSAPYVGPSGGAPATTTTTSQDGPQELDRSEAPTMTTPGDLPRPRPRRRLPPAPPKGILRPPSSSHAATSRFSFRRDILQPFNSSYSRATTTAAATTAGDGPGQAPGTTSERGAAAAAAVGEAVGTAATVAGGFFGNALKRLSAAAVATTTAAATPTQSGSAAAGGGGGAPLALGALMPGPPTGAADRSSTGIAATNGESGPLTAPPGHSQSAAASVSTLSLTPSAAPSTASTAVPSSSGASIASSTQIAAPIQPPQPPLPVSSLKLVRFRMASIKIVYPINNGTLDPIAPSDEGETRDRIEREWRNEKGLAVVSEEEGLGRVGEKGDENEKGVVVRAVGEEKRRARSYTGEELARIYNESCRTREEPGIERVKRFFRENPKSLPKVLDLSHELLSFGAVAALSDVLAIDWGCRKLVLEGCGLDDESVKPLLHALLVSACVPTISLAGNKRIRNKGWKLLAVFLRKATFLRYLDLSETSIDKKAAEWLVQAVAPPPPPPPPTAATIADTSTDPESKQPSPRPRVKGPWEDEDDSADEADNAPDPAPFAPPESAKDADEARQDLAAPRAPLFPTAPLLKEDWEGEMAAVQSLRFENCGMRGPTLEVLANGLRLSGVKHVSLRKNRMNHAGGPALAIMMRDYPLSTDASAAALNASLNSPSLTSPTIFRNGFSHGTSDVSSSPEPAVSEGRNSVTAHRRHLFKPLEQHLSHLPRPNSPSAGHLLSEDSGRNSPVPSDREVNRMTEARTKLRKQLDGLPRFGALLTLDVKGNDLRHGVTYVAQVLKRNRTLKTLNLSENRIDSQGLTAIAEALKYNSTLETLDLSHNPCCGPGVDGILALRSTLMVSHSLKRIFLNSTELTSEGAIALAEFLPESRSVLHLDLTNNNIDISGVLALSVSIKLNSTIRCLDLNIPPNDADFSRLSQDILNTCVRNTEIAQEKADSEARHAADGAKRVLVAQPIRKSALATELEEQQRAQEQRQRRRQDVLRSQQDILAAAAETRDVVRELLAVDEAAAAQGSNVRPSEVTRDALVQLQLAEAQLAEAAPSSGTGAERERVDLLLSELSSLLDLAKSLYDGPAASTKARRRPIDAGTPFPKSDRPAPPSPTLSAASSPDEEAAVEEDATGGDQQKRKPDSLDLPTQPSMLDPARAETPPVRSPIQSESRAMVEEESEVFRRGVALGVDEVSDSEDEDETSDKVAAARSEDGSPKKKSEVSGEELRKELLETPVRRSPRTSFSSDADGLPVVESSPPLEP